MLDEIKTYLEDTEADKEAEAFLLSSQARDIADKSGVSLNDSKSLGDKNSSLANQMLNPKSRLEKKNRYTNKMDGVQLISLSTRFYEPIASYARD